MLFYIISHFCIKIKAYVVASKVKPNEVEKVLYKNMAINNSKRTKCGQS